MRSSALILAGALALGGCGDTGKPPAQPPAPTTEEIRKRQSAFRTQRIRDHLERFSLSLDGPALSDLAALLDRFQFERDDWWESDAALGKSDAEYEPIYRAFVEPYLAAVRERVPVKAQGDLVIRHFVFDGRIIRPPSERPAVPAGRQSVGGK